MKRLYTWLRWRGILLLAALTPPCRKITAQCSRKLDGTRSWNSWWQLPLHFAICPGCRRYLQQLEMLHSLAADYQSRPTSPHSDAEARKDRLRRRLREVQIQSAGK